MSSTTAFPRYRVTFERRRTRSRFRAAMVWLLTMGVMAALGVAGYLFVMEVAFPGLIEGIVGQR
jgi:hypothetical protein